MQFYTVHEPPDPPVDRIERAAELEFIGDRFVPAAVILGPVWLLANRLWHAFAVYLAVMLMAAAVIHVSGLSWRWLSLMFSALNLIVAFEGASLRRWALERRGWRTLGVVSGRDVDECERRFLETWLPDQRMSREQEFISTVATLRGAGGDLAGLSAARAGGIAAGGIDAGGGLLTPGGKRRGWLPWRTAG
jgi:hypothetical protein